MSISSASLPLRNLFRWSFALVLLAIGTPALLAQDAIIPTLAFGSTTYEDTDFTCIGCSVTNADQAIDDDRQTSALINMPIGILASAHLGIELAEEMPAGSRPIFIIGSGGLLDAGVLQRMTIRTYLNGAPQETAVFGGLLVASIGSNGRGGVSFSASDPFDEVRLSIAGVVSVATNVEVYTALIRLPTVRDVVFPYDVDGATVYSGESVGCIGCSISNEGFAIDIDRQNLASINIPINVLGEAHLGVTFPEQQLSGRSVGFKVEGDTGLLDVELLNRVEVQTYLSGALQETSTAGTGLRAGVNVTRGRGRIAMRAGEPFDEVRLTIDGAAAALTQLGIYHASSAGPIMFGYFLGDTGNTLLTETYASVFGVEEAELEIINPSGEHAETVVALEAYPNPFVGTSALSLRLNDAQQVRIAVYDVLGRQVALLHQGALSGDTQHVFHLNGAGLPSGLYLYRVEGETFSQTKSVTLVR